MLMPRLANTPSAPPHMPPDPPPYSPPGSPPLDFDIAAHGRSFEDVQQLLRISIADYLESAARKSPEAAARLLRRFAPMHVVAGHIIAFPWNNFRKSDDRLEHSFQMPRPA